MDSVLELERRAAGHWRAAEEQWLGDWLLRAAGGFTGRANSALALGAPGLPLDDALDALTRWYRVRGLPPMMAVPLPADLTPVPGTLEVQRELEVQHELAVLRELDQRLEQLRWRLRADPAYVMVTEIPAGTAGLPALPAGLRYRADPVPDQAWLTAYHYRGQDQQPPVMRTMLTSAADQVFLSVRTASGGVRAIARLSLASGWAGITAVEVSPDCRRAGLGRALTAAAFAEAAQRGLTRVFLQVAVDNTGARNLYERAGFRYSHRYHYRVSPE
jgi:ribosomal protein S18 acetylase RimI-like enzyme